MIRVMKFIGADNMIVHDYSTHNDEHDLIVLANMYTRDARTPISTGGGQVQYCSYRQDKAYRLQRRAIDASPKLRKNEPRSWWYVSPPILEDKHARCSACLIGRGLKEQFEEMLSMQTPRERIDRFAVSLNRKYARTENYHDVYEYVITVGAGAHYDFVASTATRQALHVSTVMSDTKDPACMVVGDLEQQYLSKN